jgi:hypothetical protein
VKINLRLRAAEQAATRLRPVAAPRNVFDRIEELTALFLEHPPTFAPAIEAGILAAVECDTRAGLVTNPS